MNGAVRMMQAVRIGQVAMARPMVSAPQTAVWARSMSAKTKSSVKKRFFLTGSGHVKRGKCGKRHRMVSKSRANLRRLSEPATVRGGQRARVLKMMGKSRLNP